MKDVWIVKEGYFDDVTFVSSVHRTKKGAVGQCKVDGFKFDKTQGFYCNDKERLYRKIWKQNVEL